MSQPAAVEELFNTKLGKPTVIYCLHGIMSRGAEDNFDLGIKINVDSTRLMLEQARKCNGEKPVKFIFTSSIAVFGGPLVRLCHSPCLPSTCCALKLTSSPPPLSLPSLLQPHEVVPETITWPEGSYGCGKLIAETFVNEYSRRGFVDGRIIRLPTIVVRPGLPSPATSAFVSGIIREPLHGQEAICPIGDSFDDPSLDELEVWVASPENVIDNFIIASHVDGAKMLPHTRVVNLPGFTVTVKQELEALRDVAGQKTLDLVQYKKDPTNARIVGSWPRAFNNDYSLSLGFVLHDGGFKSIVESFKKGVEEGRW